MQRDPRLLSSCSGGGGRHQIPQREDSHQSALLVDDRKAPDFMLFHEAESRFHRILRMAAPKPLSMDDILDSELPEGLVVQEG